MRFDPTDNGLQVVLDDSRRLDVRRASGGTKHRDRRRQGTVAADDWVPCGGAGGPPFASSSSAAATALLNASTTRSTSRYQGHRAAFARRRSGRDGQPRWDSGSGTCHRTRRERRSRTTGQANRETHRGWTCVNSTGHARCVSSNRADALNTPTEPSQKRAEMSSTVATRSAEATW
jgi:hypothetical protein